MAFVPKGSFLMGENEGARDQRPQRSVQMDSFWIDRLPVSQADYRRFTDATGHRKPPNWVRGTYHPKRKTIQSPMSVIWTLWHMHAGSGNDFRQKRSMRRRLVARLDGRIRGVTRSARIS